jgi:membrane-bound serine protease (ClpP class)
MTNIAILCLVGIAALLFELVLPGGVLGVAGALALLGAVVATFVSYGPAAGTAALVLISAAGLGILWIWMKRFHRLPFTRRLILEETSGGGAPAADAPPPGSRGRAVTPLVPSGRVEIDGRRHDALAEAASIEAGAAVAVVARSGASLLVREVGEGDGPG